MLEVSTPNELDALLADLRSTGSDHQWVEAKAGRTALPRDLWNSLIAFANTDMGGLVLLGVDEGDAHDFVIVGVNDVGQRQDELTAACAQLEPALRPTVNVILHTQGTVIAACIPSLPQSLRPCHKEPPGMYESSYIRVGDRDDRMTRAEVDALLANKLLTDHSRRPVAPDADADPILMASLLSAARAQRSRLDGETDAHVLYQLGATQEGGQLTLAGLLSIGAAPARFSSAARVSYRKLPAEGDLRDVRQSGTHAEGTVGQVMDELLQLLNRDLPSSQLEVGGRVIDDWDVPRLALREVIGNALLHRSLADMQEASPVVVEVAPSHVLVSSPGGIHGNTEVRQLGLTARTSLRNPSLVRCCELLTTPTGERITESQASGIRAADRVCRERGAAVPLFITRPAEFEVILLRGHLPEREAAEKASALGTSVSDAERRVLAFAIALAELHEQDAASRLRDVHLDANLAARLLAPEVPEKAAVVLEGLAQKGLLHARSLPDRLAWELAVSAPTGGVPPLPQKTVRANRRAQVSTLLLAINSSTAGELGSKDLIHVLGLKSSKSRNDVLRYALDAELIVPTSDVPQNPQRKYRLTQSGTAAAEADRVRGGSVEPAVATRVGRQDRGLHR